VSKITLRLLLLLLLFSSVQAREVILKLTGGYFVPAEQAFKDVYGTGLTWGGEAVVYVWENVGLWLGGGYFGKQGRLTFTQEETRVQILPLGAGIKLKTSSEKVGLYSGLGLRYNSFKESNAIGEATKGGLGIVVMIGGIIKILKEVALDISIEYSYCRMKPADFTINIGGLSVGLGLGYEFK
jgi:hypothetical protein